VGPVASISTTQHRTVPQKPMFWVGLEPATRCARGLPSPDTKNTIPRQTCDVRNYNERQVQSLKYQERLHSRTAIILIHVIFDRIVTFRMFANSYLYDTISTVQQAQQETM
jgi:hypothetical protein